MSESTIVRPKEREGHPEPKKVIARTGECMRLLLEAGLPFEALQYPISDPAFRERLVAFWKNRGKVEVAEKENPPLLVLANEAVQYPATGPHNPDTYWMTHEGLFVDRNFRDRVVVAYADKKSEKLPAITGKSFDLLRLADNGDVIGDIIAITEHWDEWDPTELCPRLASMIEAQWGGTEGELLTNGFANLFYVPGFVVSVYWYADDREWNVYACLRGYDYWHAGDRVFPRPNSRAEFATE